jgi:UV DNA damage endonuclease
VSIFGSGGRIRRLGFAVKVLGDGGLPSHDTRRWQSQPHLSRSLQHLEAIFRYLDRNDIRMYRLASALAPYASHPDMPQFHRQVADCEAELARCGERAREVGIRLSFHPGQYTVLNSERAAVRAAAIADLELQARILDAMDLGPEAVVVIHVGGAAGGVQAGLERFLADYERLSPAAHRRAWSSRTTIARSTSTPPFSCTSAPGSGSSGTPCTTAATTRTGSRRRRPSHGRSAPGRPR